MKDKYFIKNLKNILSSLGERYVKQAVRQMTAEKSCKDVILDILTKNFLEEKEVFPKVPDDCPPASSFLDPMIKHIWLDERAKSFFNMLKRAYWERYVPVDWDGHEIADEDFIGKYLTWEERYEKSPKFRAQQQKRPAWKRAAKMLEDDKFCHLLYKLLQQYIAEEEKVKHNALELLRKVDLVEFAGKKLNKLSKGMKQLVQLIATLVHEPRLLILDEPFSGLDPANRELVKRIILEQKSKGKTIILSTHMMNEVEELCDRVLMVNLGRRAVSYTHLTLPTN